VQLQEWLHLTDRPFAFSHSKPHGRAFKVIRRDELIRDVIPGYFVCSKYESFTRQLTAWDYKRLKRGPGASFRAEPSLQFVHRSSDSNLSRPSPHLGRRKLPTDEGCYYHEAFLRGLPELTCFIRRLPRGGEKKAHTTSSGEPEEEPGKFWQETNQTLLCSSSSNLHVQTRQTCTGYRCNVPCHRFPRGLEGAVPPDIPAR